MVNDQRFKKTIMEKLHTKVNVDELQNELNNLRKNLKQLIGTKDKLGIQIDTLDVFDSSYDKKYNDLQKRLDNIYVKIEEVKLEIKNKEENIEKIIKIKLVKKKSTNFFISLI